MGAHPGKSLAVAWFAVVVVVVAAVVMYVLMAGPRDSMPDRAQVSGTLLAAVVILPPALSWAWRTRRADVHPVTTSQTQLEAAADLLASRAFASWSEQVLRRGIQSSAPVRVRWSWATSDDVISRRQLAESPNLTTDPRPLDLAEGNKHFSGQVLNSGLVTRLHDELYARLPHGRLFLIGGPGAGKTAAMMMLLLEALQHRERLPAPDRPRVPVPVWLTLGSWDSTTQTLREWIRETVARDHPYLNAAEFGPDAISHLLENGCLALFLDGLDEMPPAHRSKALERLSLEAARLRVTLTSRPEEYYGTLESGQGLPYSAVVELRPVGASSAVRYLLAGQVGAARRAWQDVADHMMRHPEGLLARTFDNPLTLSLARSVYSSGDASELVTGKHESEAALRGHLLDQILVNAYPDPERREHATYWLGWCAHNMRAGSSHLTRDLGWWQIPTWLPQRQSQIMIGIAVGLGTALVIGPLAPIAGLIVGLLGKRPGGLGADPRSVTFRWPERREVTRGLPRGLTRWLKYSAIYVIVFGLLMAVVMAFIWRTAEGTLLGLGVGSIVGLGSVILWVPVICLVTWLVGDVWSRPAVTSGDATPYSLYRMDLRAWGRLELVGALVGALAMVVLAAPVGMLLYDVELVGLLLTVGFAFFGGVMGLVISLAYPSTPRLLLAEVALSRRGRRVRFIPLLEEALHHQLLRQAGSLYQFRHAELQDRLADRYQAGRPHARRTA